MATNIKPNCLKVDRATTFLPSTSISAAILASTSVVVPNINNALTKDILACLKRTKSQTPAVTRVELCTKALTGVGAAIAAGNQLVKGTCALLVKVTRIKQKKATILPFW